MTAATTAADNGRTTVTITGSGRGLLEADQAIAAIGISLLDSGAPAPRGLTRCPHSDSANGNASVPTALPTKIRCSGLLTGTGAERQ